MTESTYANQVDNYAISEELIKMGCGVKGAKYVTAAYAKKLVNDVIESNQLLVNLNSKWAKELEMARYEIERLKRGGKQ